MTADSSIQNRSDFEGSFDPFAEPRGMSVGWDASNLPTNSGSKTDGKDQVETGRVDGDQTTELSNHTEMPADSYPEVDFDPFPEPRTVPTNWNVSALLKAENSEIGKK